MRPAAPKMPVSAATRGSRIASGICMCQTPNQSTSPGMREALTHPMIRPVCRSVKNFIPRFGKWTMSVTTPAGTRLVRDVPRAPPVRIRACDSGEGELLIDLTARVIVEQTLELLDPGGGEGHAG